LTTKLKISHNTQTVGEVDFRIGLRAGPGEILVVMTRDIVTKIVGGIYHGKSDSCRGR